MAGDAQAADSRSPAPLEPHGLAVADNPLEPLAFHPVISQGRVFVADQGEIFGFRADTGQPAWGDGGPSIYRDPERVDRPADVL